MLTLILILHVLVTDAQQDSTANILPKSLKLALGEKKQHVYSQKLSKANEATGLAKWFQQYFVPGVLISP